MLLIAAMSAGSVALAGFGVDSLIEIVASAVVIWELTGETDPGRERVALRVIAVAFVLLAVYIAVGSALTLSSSSHPKHSALGIVWLALTAGAMFALAAGKRRTGRALGNAVLQTEHASRSSTAHSPPPCWSGSSSPPPRAGGGRTRCPPSSSSYTDCSRPVTRGVRPSDPA